jgi:hypothetical protein
MGGGNVCKANAARARNAAKAGNAPSSTEDRKKHAAGLVALQCNICMQGFPATTREAELNQHLEARHAKLKKTIAEVFPNFVAS